MNQGSGCSMSAGYLEPGVAREVFGGERDVLAWGMGPGAKAIRVEGGWRITGNWAFASGSRHASWLGAHCPCFEADGTPQRHPDGRPWERTMLFRREIATIKDVWQVVGLRGTGSDAYSVQDLFVDDAHTLTRDRPEERREPGLIYRFAAMQIYASGFAAVALGAHASALDAFIDLARGKTPALTQTGLRDSAVIQSAIGIADARLNSARTWLIQVLRETQEAVKLAGELTTDQRIAIRQASTFAIHQAKEVVDVAYHEAGCHRDLRCQPVRAPVPRRQHRDAAGAGETIALRDDRSVSARGGGEPAVAVTSEHRARDYAANSVTPVVNRAISSRSGSTPRPAPSGTATRPPRTGIRGTISSCTMFSSPKSIARCTGSSAAAT